jgi:hypothetical protein
MGEAPKRGLEVLDVVDRAIENGSLAANRRRGLRLVRFSGCLRSR